MKISGLLAYLSSSEYSINIDENEKINLQRLDFLGCALEQSMIYINSSMIFKKMRKNKCCIMYHLVRGKKSSVYWVTVIFNIFFLSCLVGHRQYFFFLILNWFSKFIFFTRETSFWWYVSKTEHFINTSAHFLLSAIGFFFKVISKTQVMPNVKW